MLVEFFKGNSNVLIFERWYCRDLVESGMRNRSWKISKEKIRILEKKFKNS